jgi:TonB family protein
MAQPVIPSPPTVYRVGNGVSAPAVLRKVEADYSEDARRQRLQGVVVVQFVIDEQGVPENLKVTRSLDAGLDQKAVEAVAKWRFSPAMKDGKAVPVIVSVEVNFHLL